MKSPVGYSRVKFMDQCELVRVDSIKKYFNVGGKFRFTRKNLKAVDNISFSIKEGETLSLVGESGCGKTTLGRLILGLIGLTSGSVFFLGENVHQMNREQMRKTRRDMQIIFQNPFASLNPRKTVYQILSQAYRTYENFNKGAALREKVSELMETVELTPPPLYIDRYPHEFSGGQRQRIGIARAITLKPKFIVADEPVSALDMSVRAQILNLMKDLQARFGLTYLFITHDLSVVRSISTRVIVMYLGKLIEVAPVKKMFEDPKHPYTIGLLSATPIPNPRKARERHRIILKGEVPSPIDPPSGCRFHPRCPECMSICTEELPPRINLGSDDMIHEVSCWLYR
jgi:peptide/nickel transport system ATP-binding protein/oligopeptide transport system ATP-binding protein